MSSSSAYYPSSRHSDSEKKWIVSHSPGSDSSQRDGNDPIGAEEFFANMCRDWDVPDQSWSGCGRPLALLG